MLYDLLHLRACQGKTGGGIGVCDEDGAVQVEVILRRDGEVRAQGDGDIGDMIQVRVHGVKAVADAGEGSLLSVVTEGHEGEVQELVRAVAEDNVVSVDAVELCKAGAYVDALDFRVEVQGTQMLPRKAHGLFRRRKGALVGIELRDVQHLRLLAGGVGDEVLVFVAEKAAHLSSSNRIRALRAWPSSPSLYAKRAISGTSFLKASAG